MKVRDLKEKLNQLEDDDMEVFVAPLIEMTHLSGESEETKTSLVPSPFSRFELVKMSVSGTVGVENLSSSFLLLGYNDLKSYGINEMAGIEDAGDLVN